MADQPSIESLRDHLDAMVKAGGIHEGEAASALSAAITELAALRESDASLRAENEALRAELEECKSKRKAFIEEVNAKLLDRDTLLANWNEALEERDAERARADAMAARVEALKPLLAALESALKVAEEAFGFLGEVRYFCTHCCGQEPDLAASGAMAVCKKCGYCMGRIDPRSEYVAALAAIRGVKNKSGTGVDADSNPTTLREGE